jgi:hypothetical protein
MTPDERYAITMACRWTTVNSTIFSDDEFIVTTADIFPALVVAFGVCEDMARHIADLHNAWLLDVQALIQGDE